MNRKKKDELIALIDRLDENPAPKKRGTFKEFSKRVIVAMTLVWFIGALFAAAMLVWQTFLGQAVMLDGILTYIGAPMTGGIVAYLIKSAAENRVKIAKNSGLPDEPPEKGA